MSSQQLNLYKENFKFSAAHFLIFDEKRAERLHGHNYQVKVDIEIPAQGAGRGYYIDFNEFKTFIRERLEKWDEIVLLPARHPDMKVEEKGPSLHVNFRDRYYVFPKNEVLLLPIENTSVEELSRLLAEDFLKEFSKVGVKSLSVLVEETSGQGCTTRV